ncbi:unnamed protein product [Protopolystoma xenopodis]|uniref:Uncharacterized protein n=1 Tax=Protopolystoma xenopodis TaxID=117903 RepID=A0A448XG70_9PLAT|nr:unnamed protein product [Protopolystoma xenopodis]
MGAKQDPIVKLRTSILHSRLDLNHASSQTNLPLAALPRPVFSTPSFSAKRDNSSSASSVAITGYRESAPSPLLYAHSSSSSSTYGTESTLTNNAASPARSEVMDTNRLVSCRAVTRTYTRRLTSFSRLAQTAVTRMDTVNAGLRSLTEANQALRASFVTPRGKVDQVPLSSI